MPSESPRTIATTRRELAETFRVTIKTVDGWIHAWRKVSDCPCATGHYDVTWIAEWLLSRKQTPVQIRESACKLLNRSFARYGDQAPTSTGDGGTIDLKTELLKEQIRKERASATTQELKNQTLTEDLIEKHTVRQWASEFHTQIRTLLTRLPGDMYAGRTSQGDRSDRQELEKRIELVLNALYRFVMDMDMEGEAGAA
jgi:hypothetical protein